MKLKENKNPRSTKKIIKPTQFWKFYIYFFCSHIWQTDGRNIYRIHRWLYMRGMSTEKFIRSFHIFTFLPIVAWRRRLKYKIFTYRIDARIYMREMCTEKNRSSILIWGTTLLLKITESFNNCCQCHIC